MDGDSEGRSRVTKAGVRFAARPPEHTGRAFSARLTGPKARNIPRQEVDCSECRRVDLGQAADAAVVGTPRQIGIWWKRGFTVADHIAIKRLTASDCTFFEAVFRKINAGNQKSINLNADVLTGRIYPTLADTAAINDNEIPLPISIFGPGGKERHSLTRKIIKNSSYKNWRLNGEFVLGPPADPTRYDDMRPGDLAVMGFQGVVAPIKMDLILVSQNDAADASLHTALDNLLLAKSMIEVTPTEIATAAKIAGVLETHPIFIAAADPEYEAAVEDAALGGISGIAKLLRSKGGKTLSAIDLAKAKARADQIGRDGEGLMNAYLSNRLATGEFATYTWVSSVNAVSPYDFEITSHTRDKIYIDAKSTTGPFSNTIHLSLAEIIKGAAGTPYFIYRLYELNQDGCKLQISEDIGPVAKNLKAIHEAHIPNGIRVDGFSFSTDTLKWGDEKIIERPDE